MKTEGKEQNRKEREGEGKWERTERGKKKGEKKEKMDGIRDEGRLPACLLVLRGNGRPCMRQLRHRWQLQTRRITRMGSSSLQSTAEPPNASTRHYRTSTCRLTYVVFLRFLTSVDLRTLCKLYTRFHDKTCFVFYAFLFLSQKLLRDKQTDRQMNEQCT